MALRTSASEELPSINLTPMIDVVFLLIIFFMVGTQFNEQERQIEVSIPNAGELNTMLAPPPRREIAVTAEGAILLDQQQFSVDELTARLKSMRLQFPDLRVVVRADGRAEHQAVAAVYGAVSRAGVADMSIAVRQHAATQR